MTTAKDFFERVRSASVDAEMCLRQIEALEQRAKSLGGGGFEPRTRSTPDPQRMEGRIARYVDMQRKLEERQKFDYELIGEACKVLYGPDEDGRGGIAHALSITSADILWWRYLDDATWDAVARFVGKSARTCQTLANGALAWIDETRFMSGIIDAV